MDGDTHTYIRLCDADLQPTILASTHQFYDYIHHLEYNYMKLIYSKFILPEHQLSEFAFDSGKDS